MLPVDRHLLLDDVRLLHDRLLHDPMLHDPMLHDPMLHDRLLRHPVRVRCVDDRLLARSVDGGAEGGDLR